MPTLPTVGGDFNTWGTEMNDYISEAHNPDGTHGFVIYDGELVTYDDEIVIYVED